MRASLPCYFVRLAFVRLCLEAPRLLCRDRFASLFASLLPPLFSLGLLPRDSGPSCDKKRTLSSTTFSPLLRILNKNRAPYFLLHTPPCPGPAPFNLFVRAAVCEPLISYRAAASLRFVLFLNSPQSILLAFSSYWTLLCRFYSLLSSLFLFFALLHSGLSCRPSPTPTLTRPFESSLTLAGLVIRTSPHRHITLHLHPCFCAAPATRIAHAQPIHGAHSFASGPLFLGFRFCASPPRL